MMLKRVDLPQPLGPMTEMNSPSLTVKEMPSSATSVPSGVAKSLRTPSMTRAPVTRSPAGDRLVAVEIAADLAEDGAERLDLGRGDALPGDAVDRGRLRQE